MRKPTITPGIRPVLVPVWRVTRATLVQAWADRVLGLAAEVGFWALLSLTPLLLVLVAAVGYLGSLFGAHIVGQVEAKILSVAGHLLAQAAVHNVLKPVLSGVLNHGHGGIASLSLVLALWTGSTAMSTYVNTIAIAYGMRDVRSAVRARLIAFLIYLGALLLGIVALPLLVAAPQWFTAAVPRAALPVVQPLASYAYWPVLVVLCTGLLATLYHVASPRRGRWRRDLPGAVAAMALWLVSSAALRAYLSFAIGHSPTYGALSAPVAALLFLYFTALAVLLGAELNAQIAGLRPVGQDPSSPGQRPVRPAAGREPAEPGQRPRRLVAGRKWADSRGERTRSEAEPGESTRSGTGRGDGTRSETRCTADRGSACRAAR